MSDITEADRQRIVALVRRADELATARDVDGYLALTTSDMVLDGTQGTASGHAAVRAAITSIWAAEPVGTRHLTSGITVTAHDGGTAAARSTLSLATASTSHVWAIAAITQTFRRVGGEWLITRRDVSWPIVERGQKESS